MSGNVQQGPWASFVDEPDKEAQDHAGAALYAMQMAQKHAETAGKHADSVQQAMDALQRVEELVKHAEEVVQRTHEMGSTQVESMQAVAQAIGQLVDKFHQTHRESMDKISGALTTMAKPRKVVRDKDGRMSGVEVS